MVLRVDSTEALPVKFSPVRSQPVALITGGEGALGKSIAAKLRAEGWEVLAPGRVELEVTKQESVHDYFKKIPQLNALIHSAGVLADQLISKMTSDDWDEVMQCHLSGAWRCSREAIPLLEKSHGGHLLFIGSWSAFQGPVGQANYAAAKAGLIGLSQSLAKECGEKNIRSNVILPGYLPTKLNRSVAQSRVEEIQSEHVLGRFNTLEEASCWASFLLGTENVSGQIFQLDSRVRRWA